MATEKKNGRRAVIVGGVRTPFVKAFTDFTKLDTIALGVAAVTGLLKKSGLRHRDVEAMIWGGVILPTTAPNLAREIALDVRLDPSCEGFTVTRACASGLQAVTAAASAIERGDNDVIIAGGAIRRATRRSRCRRRWSTPWLRSRSEARPPPPTIWASSAS